MHHIAGLLGILAIAIIESISVVVITQHLFAAITIAAAVIVDSPIAIVVREPQLLVVLKGHGVLGHQFQTAVLQQVLIHVLNLRKKWNTDD